MVIAVSHIKAKIVASMKAIEILTSKCSDGCILGLGTGSTVRTFIDLLFAQNLETMLRRSLIIASSYDTALLLLSKGVLNVNVGLPSHRIDVYIDSADEVDRRCYMIKGGGGAVLREKILTYLANEKIFIVDESKVSEYIGMKKPVPVEIEPFAYTLIQEYLKTKGYAFELRYSKSKYGPVITDNGNFILDIRTGPLQKPQSLDAELTMLPGVVVTGIFRPEHVSTIIVGFDSGEIEILYPA